MPQERIIRQVSTRKRILELEHMELATRQLTASIIQLSLAVEGMRSQLKWLHEDANNLVLMFQRLEAYAELVKNR